VAPTSRCVLQTGLLSNYLTTKPAKIDFLSGSSNTVVDQTGIDVIDNAGNTAAELSANALTLGDLGGNASLGKAGIEAANNLKDAISGTTTDVTNSDQSLLIYDVGAGEIKRSSNSITRHCGLLQRSHSCWYGFQKRRCNNQSDTGLHFLLQRSFEFTLVGYQRSIKVVPSRVRPTLFHRARGVESQKTDLSSRMGPRQKWLVIAVPQSF
jgi:hypothetical protein